jgi:hypothetical protein
MPVTPLKLGGQRRLRHHAQLLAERQAGSQLFRVQAAACQLGAHLGRQECCAFHGDALGEEQCVARPYGAQVDQLGRPGPSPASSR